MLQSVVVYLVCLIVFAAGPTVPCADQGSGLSGYSTSLLQVLVGIPPPVSLALLYAVRTRFAVRCCAFGIAYWYDFSLVFTSGTRFFPLEQPWVGFRPPHIHIISGHRGGLTMDTLWGV